MSGRAADRASSAASPACLYRGHSACSNRDFYIGRHGRAVAFAIFFVGCKRSLCASKNVTWTQQKEPATGQPRRSCSFGDCIKFMCDQFKQNCCYGVTPVSKFPVRHNLAAPKKYLDNHRDFPIAAKGLPVHNQTDSFTDHIHRILPTGIDDTFVTRCLCRPPPSRTYRRMRHSGPARQASRDCCGLMLLQSD